MIEEYVVCKIVDKRFRYYLQNYNGKFEWNGLLDNAVKLNVHEATVRVLYFKRLDLGGNYYKKKLGEINSDVSDLNP